MPKTINNNKTKHHKNQRTQNLKNLLNIIKSSTSNNSTNTKQTKPNKKLNKIRNMFFNSPKITLALLKNLVTFSLSNLDLQKQTSKILQTLTAIFITSTQLNNLLNCRPKTSYFLFHLF